MCCAVLLLPCNSAGTDAEHSLALHDWSAATGGAAEGGLLASGKVIHTTNTIPLAYYRSGAESDGSVFWLWCCHSR
jgi:hypothetical protein